MIDQPCADEGDRLEAAVRMLREARDDLRPWYMLQPSMSAKSLPELRPASDAAGARQPLPRG